MSSRFVSIEGLHGVGKTTVATSVAHRLGVTLTPTVPAIFSDVRKHMDESDCIEARYMLFLAATMYSGVVIKNHLQSGKDVVVESYIYRTIAFHEGMGSLVTVNTSDQLFLPTHTILLTCDPDVRLQRLKLRGGIRGRWDELAESKSVQILKCYQRFGFPSIDTTDLLPEMVSDKVLEIIG